MRASAIGSVVGWFLLGAVIWAHLNTTFTMLVFAVSVTFTVLTVAHAIALLRREGEALRGHNDGRELSRREFLGAVLKAGIATWIALFLYPRANLPTYAQQTSPARTMHDWLKEHPEVITKALAANRVSKEQVPDIALKQPSKYLDIVKTVATESRLAGAPETVIKGLDAWLGAVSTGSKDLGRYEYARKTLLGIKDPKNDKTVEAALRNAIKNAPDQANRAKLESMLEKIRLMSANKDVATKGRVSCALCCLGACALCEEFCRWCCVIGCGICG